MLFPRSEELSSITTSFGATDEIERLSSNALGDKKKKKRAAYDIHVMYTIQLFKPYEPHNAYRNDISSVALAYILILKTFRVLDRSIVGQQKGRKSDFFNFKIVSVRRV